MENLVTNHLYTMLVLEVFIMLRYTSGGARISSRYLGWVLSILLFLLCKVHDGDEC